MVSEKTLNSLRDLLGSKNFITSIRERRFFSQDLFYEGILPIAIISPNSISDLEKSIKICEKEDIEIFPRGGGLSYTSGYLKTKENGKSFIVFDLRKINKIIEINEDNLTATVEAGCTWEKLYKETKKINLRPKMFGPSTGRFSTIGGSATNNSMFFGSAQSGTSADNILGLEVVTSKGRIIKTGSDSIINGKAFYRNNGPDITGLFLNDGGIMGIKTKITLMLEQVPSSEKFISLSFKSSENLINAIKDLGRTNLTSECIGIIPSTIGNPENLHDPSLHIVVEGWTDDIAEKKMDAVKEILNSFDKPQYSDPIIPKLFREKLFGFLESPLDTNGNLQIWTHGVFPFDKIKIAYEKMNSIFQNNEKSIKNHRIESHISLAVSKNAVMLEPVMKWNGSPSMLHILGMNNADLKDYKNNNQNENETKVIVNNIRNQIEECMRELGAAHMQYGRFYSFAESTDSNSIEFIRSIKDIIDPKRLFNPDALNI